MVITYNKYIFLFNIDIQFHSQKSDETFLRPKSK